MPAAFEDFGGYSVIRLKTAAAAASVAALLAGCATTGTTSGSSTTASSDAKPLPAGLEQDRFGVVAHVLALAEGAPAAA